MTGLGKDTRSEEPNPGLLHGWKGTKCLCHHHCLSVSVLAASWNQELGVGLECRHSHGGHRPSSHQLLVPSGIILSNKMSVTFSIYKVQIECKQRSGVKGSSLLERGQLWRLQWRQPGWTQTATDLPLWLSLEQFSEQKASGKMELSMYCSQSHLPVIRKQMKGLLYAGS